MATTIQPISPGAAVARASTRLAACLLVLLAACARTPPEEALRGAVSGLQAAIDARDPGAVAEFIAEDFIGPDGLDRAGARRMATVYLMRSRSVSATPGPLDIALQERHARVRFAVALTSGSGRLLPDSATVYAVDSGWREEGGGWKLTSARWTPEY